MKLHLGCGKNYKHGWINVDCLESTGADVICDLNARWPFPDNSVDQIYSTHCFEHLNSISHTMSECHRVLKPGATMDITVPFAMSQWQFQDPTHRVTWMPETIDYYDSAKKGMPKYYDFDFDVELNELTDMGINYGMHNACYNWRLWLRNRIPFRSKLRFVLMSMYDELHFVLRKPIQSTTP